jgi:hypothetical protein
MAEGGEKKIGAHGGGIPPGWDTPEARAAAENGEDLWLLDAISRRTPWERFQAAAKAARFMETLRAAGRKPHGI